MKLKNQLINIDIDNQIIFKDENLKNGVHLAIEGGGIRSTVGLGVYKALEEYNIPITSVSGTSLGSIAATFIACKQTSEEILNLFLRYNFILTDAGVTGSGKGNSTIIEKEVNKELKKIIYPELDENELDLVENITFKELPTDLYINTTNGNFIKSVLNAKEYIFSKETTPDMSIGEACRASTRLPIFYNKYEIEYENDKIKPLDGGMVKNPTLPKEINKPIILSTFDRDKQTTIDFMIHKILKKPIEKVRDSSFSNSIEISPDLRNIGITGSNEDMIKAFNKGYEETIKLLKKMNINKETKIKI